MATGGLRQSPNRERLFLGGIEKSGISILKCAARYGSVAGQKVNCDLIDGRGLLPLRPLFNVTMQKFLNAEREMPRNDLFP